MKIKHILASLIISTLVSTPFAYACPPQLMPDTTNLGQYQTIFIGEVLNVRQVHAADWNTLCVNGKHNRTHCHSTKNNNTARPEYEVNAVSRTSIMGTPSTTEKMMLQGCGVQIPRVLGYGIFFIPKNNKQPVIPIYQTESLLYSNLLLKLGALEPKSSNWDALKK
ncbi:MAG: hypothetical protein KGK44_10815 [Gammaproteobacteria bacterium]|nr:hypothetical protein [Gammaproteobacteria bacterium]